MALLSSFSLPTFSLLLSHSSVSLYSPLFLSSLFHSLPYPCSFSFYFDAPLFPSTFSIPHSPLSQIISHSILTLLSRSTFFFYFSTPLYYSTFSLFFPSIFHFTLSRNLSSPLPHSNYPFTFSLFFLNLLGDTNFHPNFSFQLSTLLSQFSSYSY